MTTIRPEIDREIRLKMRIERLRRQIERLEAEGRGETFAVSSLRAQLRLDLAAEKATR